MKIRAFTLLEILIVLIVISIVMGMTFYFGSERLQQLAVQTSRVQFADYLTYTKQQILSNPYYEQEAVDTISLTLEQGSVGRQRSYWRDNQVLGTQIFTGDQGMYLAAISHDNHEFQEAILYLHPYQTICTISLDQQEILSGDVHITLAYTANSSRYCFALQPRTCTLRPVSCPAL